MAHIGTLNELRVVKETYSGVYLDAGELGEILLPQQYVPAHCRTGDRLTVFLYTDSEDRPIATTESPHAVVGDFALLTVVAETPVGAFLDWGLPKDLLVPFREQNTPMKKGRSYIVRVYLDERSQRVVASAKLDRFLSDTSDDLHAGQEVDLLVCNWTTLGRKVIINRSQWGLLHSGDIYQPLQRGQRLTGFVKTVREDMKIDVCLHQPGYAKIQDISAAIMAALEQHGGRIPVTDKSTPEHIGQWFGVSKKTYKKALGALYKKRLVTLTDTHVSLNQNSPNQNSLNQNSPNQAKVTRH